MLSALHSVVIEVADLAAGRRDFEALLERSPSGDAFVLSNMRLALRSARGGAEGIAGLRFALAPGGGAGLRAGVFANPSVPIELVADEEPDPASGVHGEPDGGREDASRSIESGVVGLDHVVIATAAPERLRALLADDLGIRLALDRSFPARGLRLLFFRLGGVTIEVAARLAETHSDAAPAASPGPDAFHGLAWRVVGLEGLHARLGQSGLALSPIRPGHKPGTRVCTVAAPVHGVPTLLIEHPARPGW